MGVDASQLNNFENFFRFKYNWVFKRFVSLKHKIILLIYGNQSGKTSSAAYQYVLRILGLHPVANKNVVYYECSNGHEYAPYKHKIGSPCEECAEPLKLHERQSRTFRFCSATLPGQSSTTEIDGGTSEVKNTQYPEFKKWLPPHLIKKDITVRNPALVIEDPYGGKDIVVEFVSYSQSVQSTAGVQRLSIWCVAEGQRVLKSDGTWVPIEYIEEDDELIAESLGGYSKRQRVNKVEKRIYKGEKEVFKVKCQKGIEFETTEDHLIMVPGLGKSKYKQLKYLSVGDWVTCKLSNIEGKDTIDEKYIKWLGFLIGDGGTSDNRIMFYQKDKNKLENLFAEEKVYWHKNSDGVWRAELKNDKFKKFLKDNNIWGDTCSNKKVPDIIFKQSNKSISTFLRYLFGTDGWCSGHLIRYASTSKRLVQDISFLLRRLKIQSTITEREFKNNWSKQYWINITKASDVLDFCDIVGVFGKDTSKVRHEAERRYKVRNEKGKRHKYTTKVKIKSIESVGIKKVYDIVMRRTRSPLNNFLISGGVVVHNCDESPDMGFYEEQLPRLLAENGDLIFTYTPVDRSSWLFDELYDKASVIYRSQYIIDFIGKETKAAEETDSPYDIAVIMAATDDNPTLKPEVIDALFNHIDDPDVIGIRRYGIFKQLSGRIFKDFDYGVHAISNELFPNGIPKDWVHARGIDYHPQTPWAFIMAAMSPTNEVFVWGEWNPSPEKYTTKEIANQVAIMGRLYKFRLSLIDPLAQATKKDHVTVLDDLNNAFLDLKREGIGRATIWQPWDTKGERGRDAIRERLKNSLTVKEPFNNKVVVNGRPTYLPTIWVFRECKQMLKSLKNWRWEEWANIGANTNKDAKNKPEQKWSHFNTALEAMFKEPYFRPAMTFRSEKQIADYYHRR